MKALSLVLSIIVVATARAEPLRLILVPQQVVIPRQSSAAKFDLFLYNSGSAARVVPSLHQFRALYTIRYHTKSDSLSRADIRAFSHPIKDHTLKAKGVDHAAIEIDLLPDDGDYVELRVEVGHDERALASNTVLLLCSPTNSTMVEPLRGTQSSNQAMQLTASKPDVYAWSVCRRERMLRGMHRGLAAADLVSR